MSDQSMSRSSSEMSVCWRSPVSSSSRSSSSSFRSRASSSSRVSMSPGSSIENTRKSPSVSISTVAWRDAPGVFLYAASNASSSAETSAPSSIPLSRSISRTASMISWLISHPLVDEVRPHDLVVRNFGVVDLHVARIRGHELPLQLPAPERAELLAAPDCAGEMLGLAQRPLDAWGRHVDAVLAEVVAQGVGYPRAQRVVDACGMVDVHGEAIRALQLDREHLDAVEAAFDALRDLGLQLLLLLPYVGHETPLVTKNGPAGPFRRTGENGVASVAISPGFGGLRAGSSAGAGSLWTSRERRPWLGREASDRPPDRGRRAAGRARGGRRRPAPRHGGHR